LVRKVTVKGGRHHDRHGPIRLAGLGGAKADERRRNRGERLQETGGAKRNRRSEGEEGGKGTKNKQNKSGLKAIRLPGGKTRSRVRLLREKKRNATTEKGTLSNPCRGTKRFDGEGEKKMWTSSFSNVGGGRAKDC